MKEKTKFLTNKFLLILAIISFIIASLEGILYYMNEDLFFRILLVLNNSVNAFAFKPSITLKDAIVHMNENYDILHSVVCHVYGIAVITAPYCTIAVVYKVFEKMLRFVFNFRHNKNCEHIIIFGYNDSVKAIIKNHLPDKNMCIHIVAPDTFSDEERYNLSRNGYIVHNFDILMADESEVKFLLDKAGADKTRDIILFDDNPINNFSILQIFCLRRGGRGYLLRNGTKITCRCEEDSISELISDYYNISKEENYGYDLELVSIPELQIRKMFSDVPLYSYYLNGKEKLSSWNTHMLILGFGSIGQQALLQAINLGVVHNDNSVTVDIFDKDIDNKMESFANRFNFDTFESQGNSYRLKSSAADGKLTINCHKINVKFREFIETIRRKNFAEPYTYAVVAIDNVNTSVNCAMRLANIFDNNESPSTPIILRMNSDKRLAKYIRNNNQTFSDVRLLEDKSIVLSIDMILNKEINQKAKSFHSFYSNIQILSKGEEAGKKNNESPDALWNKSSMFKRDSSKALAEHEKTKQIIFSQTASEFGISNIDAKIDELIGKNGILMNYDGYSWHLNEDDDTFLRNLKNDSFAYHIAMMEHRRWCYFVASQGWKNGIKRDDKRKIHTCLVPFSQLINDPSGRKTIKYDLMSLMARYLENHQP